MSRCDDDAIPTCLSEVNSSSACRMSCCSGVGNNGGQLPLPHQRGCNWRRRCTRDSSSHCETLSENEAEEDYLYNGIKHRDSLSILMDKYRGQRRIKHPCRPADQPEECCCVDKYRCNSTHPTRSLRINLPPEHPDDDVSTESFHGDSDFGEDCCGQYPIENRRDEGKTTGLLCHNSHNNEFCGRAPTTCSQPTVTWKRSFY